MVDPRRYKIIQNLDATLTHSRRGVRGGLCAFVAPWRSCLALNSFSNRSPFDLVASHLKSVSKLPVFARQHGKSLGRCVAVNAQLAVSWRLLHVGSL